MSPPLRTPPIAAVALAGLIGGLLPAAPADAAIRCGTHLISEGDTAGELERRCGPPTEVDRRTTWRPPIVWRYGRPIRVPGGEIEVAVEYWLYNFGPNLLMRRVTVEDGRVKEIETLGRGYL